MKIIVPISTRDRPMRLAGVLHSLTTLASGRTEIDYVVGMDEYDWPTVDISDDLAAAYGCEIVVRKRPATLGQAWNELVADRAWDACAVIADKHLCLTQNWDLLIEEVIGARDTHACRWHLLPKPEETLLIVSRKFYEGLGRQLFPEWFPFWFSERWVWEVHQFALGTGIPMVTNMPMSEPIGATQGLRDLEFWFDFFARTRRVRLASAHKLAIHLGRAIINPLPLIAEMEQTDAWQIPRIPHYYEHRGVKPGQPTPEYLRAKARAADFLREVAHAA